MNSRAQGAELEFKPRVLRRYVNNSNRTFKSDLMAGVMSQPLNQEILQQHRKSLLLDKQHDPLPIRPVDQLDLAAREFDSKKVTQSAANPQQTQRNHLNDYLNSYNRILQEQQPQHKLPRQSRRSQSVALMKIYVNNDEGVYARQSKPYNIISNQPHEINELRRYPKLSGEYKRELFHPSQ